ncbi:S41 family peptidase [Fluviicola sp.]|uniref:S41 family peptidase n=1 Tax=Fluviicola sp. TaxID=1917219 RepID=UPI0026262CF2|nr:S41 family peptidase [Fluviicola sp.]
MRNNTLKRTPAIISFLILSYASFGQAKQYFYFSKAWNFIKYYHPDLATGKIDADSLFLANIQRINSKQTCDEVIAVLIADLSKPTSLKKQFVSKETDLLKQNQDFGWYEKNSEISKKTRATLRTIYDNRFTGEDHFYLTKQGWESELPNEKKYEFKKEENLPLAYRLLTFAKIQGVVDYLYPYKYLMSNPFDRFGMEKLPQLIECNTRKELEEIIARLISTLEDTHAFRFYEQLKFKKELFHSTYYPPFDYQVFNDYILVMNLISPELCTKASLQVGDRIYMVNNQKVSELIADKSKLLSSSNQTLLIHKLSAYLSNIVWNNDSPVNTFRVGSNGKERDCVIEFISVTNKSQVAEINDYFQKKQQSQKTPEAEKKDFAYFKINHIYHLVDTISDDKEIDRIMDSVLEDAASKKAIVFDMRGYPDWGGFVHTYIYKYFAEKDNYYHRIYFPNPENIGTWLYNGAAKEYFPDIPGKTRHSYAGKVFILVNPETLSASEFYTMNLQYVFPGAVTIGQTTAGADGNVKTMNLPGGYELSFTGLGVFYPNGDLTQKVGVRITESINYTDEDVILGRDKEMDKVIELLEK